MPGIKIGDYEIKEEPFLNSLGGAVYEGIKPETGELFLFKKMKKEPGGSGPDAGGITCPDLFRCL